MLTTSRPITGVIMEQHDYKPSAAELTERLLCVISIHDLERLVRHIEGAVETGYGKAWITFANGRADLIAHEATDKA